MGKFFVKRLALSILILFFVTLLLYSIMRCLPTSYVERRARELSGIPGSKTYEEWLSQLSETYGYDTDCSIPEGYIRWLKSALRGEFGDSWQWSVKVTEKFADVIGYSAALSIPAFILQIIIAIPLGILAAKNQYSRMDFAVTGIALIGISLPDFFFAAMLKFVFSVKLGCFDLYGIVGRNHEQLKAIEQILDYAHHMVLPVFTLTIISFGSLVRHTRAGMLEVLHADFVCAARARGLPEGRVMCHAFRNTLIPIVTILGGSLPGLFAGAMITETLFQIPGIGYTAYQSMVNGDIPFSMFYLTFLAVLILLGNLLSDMLYAVVDPRVRVN